MPPAAAQARASGTSRLRKYRHPLPSELVIVANPAAGLLDQASKPLGLESSPSLGLGDSARFPGFRDHQRLRDQRHQPLSSCFPIPQLAPGGRRHDPNPAIGIEAGAEFLEQSLSLGFVHRRAVTDVPPNFDPGRGLVDVLASRPAGAGGSELELGVGNLDHVANDNSASPLARARYVSPL